MSAVSVSRSQAATGQTAIELRQLCKSYQLGVHELPVLKGIDLCVPRGDYVAIMGPSGSGKSTLLNILGCLDRPTSGEFRLAGEDVGCLADDELSAIRASRIGFVFQSYNLIPQLTVLENIETPLHYRGHMALSEREQCKRLADRVGLADRLGHRPFELSGGQQQRAGIARSLANQPRFILADEPTGNLDSHTTEEILALLDELNDEGRTIVMVTHEEDVARRARRVIRMLDGTIQSDERLRPVAGQAEEATDEDSLADNRPPASPWTAAVSGLLLTLKTLQLGAQSLRLHPLRSLLTVLGIFIGVASVIWLLAIGEGISAKVQNQIADLGARNILLITQRPPRNPNQQSVVPYGVTQRDYQQLRKTIPGIEQIAPMRTYNQRTFSYRERATLGQLVGCTPEYQEMNRLRIAAGRFLTPSDEYHRAKVCVLSQTVARELFSFESPVGKSIHIDADYYRVVGVVRERAAASGIGDVRSQDYSDNAYIPISTFWERIPDVYARTFDGVPIASQVTVQMRDQSDVLPTAGVIRQTLDEWHEQDDFTVTVPLELLEQARSSRLMFIAMMGLIAAISLVVGGIGIMNIMLATVTERTREIGIRRAIGARQGDITRQFLAETVLLSVVGGVAGILGGLTCRPLIIALRELLETSFPELIETMPDAIQDITPIVVPWSIPLAFGIAVAVGVVFGLYPAIRAARMNPIDALRHVG